MKKLLALLFVIAMVGVLCAPAMAAPSNVPVAAQVPEDWTTAYLYAWNDNGDAAAWPGVPMVLVDDWFCAYMPDDMNKVIINNGSGAQTPDLEVETGMPVCVMAMDITSPDVDYELPVEVPAEDAMPKPAMDTVYALVPESWTTANLYAWGDNGEAAGWPGTAMTKGEDGLWVGELTPGYANIIINDGGVQTVDLPYAGGECWVMLAAEPGADGKFEANVLYEEPAELVPPTEIVPPVAGPAFAYTTCYVAGTFNSWTNPDEAYKMEDNGDGTFTLTFSITAGDHALKVTDGTWDHSVGGSGADGNYEFNAASDCEITVDFDGTTVTVTGDIGEPTGNGGETAAPAGDTWYVAGTMNEWNCADEAYKMTANGDGTFSLTLDLAAGAHELKVTNGTWDVSFGANGGADNFIYDAAAQGTYTITFDGTNIQVAEGAAPSTNTDKGNDTAAAKDGEAEGGSNTGLIVGVGAGAVAVVGGVAAAFALKKKKD